METIYLEDNLHTVVKLERLPDADSEIDNLTAMEQRTKIGEIFEISRDHLAFVCIHCAAEFSLFIQFAAHIEKHLQQINSNSIEAASKNFPADSGLHHIDIKPLIPPKYELESDEELMSLGGAAVADDQQDSHLANTNVRTRTPRETHTTRTNQLNEEGTWQTMGSQLNVDDTTEQNRRRSQIRHESRRDLTASKKSLNKSKTSSSQKNTQKASIAATTKTFECFECHREFGTRYAKRHCKAHVRSHLNTRKQCMFCSMPALAGTPIECFFCHAVFARIGPYSEHGLASHKLTDEKLKLLRQMCRRCSIAFKSKSLAERQMELDQWASKHYEQNFKCKLCGKVVSGPEPLRRHMVLHDGQKNFKCEICGNSYAIGYRWGHMRTHTDVKKYQCSECGALCRSLYGLNIHVLTHTGEKPHQCKYCLKHFRARSLLNCHVRMHTGEFLHYCTPCKKGYTCKQGLQKHNHKVHGMPKK